MATGGLYGQSSAGIVSPQSGSESSGLYGNNTVFGGTYFEWFIFQVSDVQPDTPTGGSWDFSTNVGTAPNGWLASPPVNPTNTVWVSVGVVSSKNNTAIVWSEPGKFSFASGLPILSGASAPVSGDGQSDQLYIETGTTPETIWFKQAGTWTRLTGSSLYMDLTSNQTIAGTKTFSSEIQGSVSGTSSNVSGIVDITHGGTGSTTASAARAALGAAASGANSDITSLSGITGGISTADYLQLDTAITPSVGVAKLQWDTTWGGPQIGMEGGNVNLQIGQETLIRVYNNTGSSLTDGQVVYVTGSQGQRLTVALAQANADSTSAAIIGMVTETIANNSSGFVTTQGMVNGINTNGFTDGAVVYLSPTTPGAWTTTKPVAPQHMVMVGYIVKGGSVGAGSIYINTQNGYELDELHNVLITSPVTGQTITYDSGTGVWSNNTVSLTSGVNGTLPIANGGTGQTTANAAFNALAPSQTGNSGKYLTTDGSNTSWATNPLGTVTSVGGTGTVSGITLSGTVTTSGNLTLGGSLDLSSPPAIGSTTPSTGAFTTLTTTSTINGLTVGKGAGAVSTNTAVGASALANGSLSGGSNTGVGYSSLNANTTGANNTAVANGSLEANTTGAENSAFGSRALRFNTTGSYNSAFGRDALFSNTTTGYNAAVGSRALYSNTQDGNTAVGYDAGYSTTTGGITAVGYYAGRANTTGAALVAVGNQSARSNTTGGYNTALGDQSLYSNTTASNNTAVGYQAGYSNTTGPGNTIVGYQAGYTNSTGNSGTFIGNLAGYNSTGDSNTAIGGATLYANTSGTSNVAVGSPSGYATMRFNTTGSYNTVIGSGALALNTTASNNTAVGYQAAYANQTGTRLVAVGWKALNLTTVSDNVAVGYNVLSANTTGAYNTALGPYDSSAYSPLNSNTTGSSNTALGAAALGKNTTASNNTAVGYQAAYSNTTGAGLVAIGYQAGYANTTGADNVAIGRISLATNQVGTRNVAVGTGSLNNSTASDNVALGYTSLYVNSTGANNTAVGSGALQANTTASSNGAFGYQALYSNTTGTFNNAFGQYALQANTTASYNNAFGHNALGQNTTGASNTAMGWAALYSNTTASNNTAVGYQAGYSNTTGVNNAFFGWSAGYSNTTGEENTFIGNYAGYAVTTGIKNTIIGRYSGNQGGLDIRTASNYIVLSDGDGNPRGIFDSSGNFLVGTTVLSNTERLNVTFPGSSKVGLSVDDTSATSCSVMIIRNNGTICGSISKTTTATAYNTSSDYRLKHDIAPMTGALNKVTALKPVTYKWNADNSDGQGFIAHELAEVCPDAVHGVKDAVETYIDADGNEQTRPVYQGIDTSFLVATLTAAIQEQQAIITQLQADVAALKGN